MALVTQTDDVGNTITFKTYQGRNFLPITVENLGDQLEKISSLQCRSDDVLLCTFPKSGTHWMFNMVKMLQKKSTEYSGTPYTLEYEDIEILEKMKSPRLLHTHLTYPFIPKAVKDGHLKVIYVIRNPKDVACSYYNFIMKFQTPTYTGSFDGFLNVFLNEEVLGSGGAWFTHTKEWNAARTTNPNLKILFLRFEDLIKNLYTNIVHIAKFLEVDYDETFLMKVEETVAFENLRKLHSPIPWWDSEKWKHDGDKQQMLPIYRKVKNSNENVPWLLCHEPSRAEPTTFVSFVRSISLSFDVPKGDGLTKSWT